MNPKPTPHISIPMTTLTTPSSPPPSTYHDLPSTTSHSQTQTFSPNSRFCYNPSERSLDPSIMGQSSLDLDLDLDRPLLNGYERAYTPPLLPSQLMGKMRDGRSGSTSALHPHSPARNHPPNGGTTHEPLDPAHRHDDDDGNDKDSESQSSIDLESSPLDPSSDPSLSLGFQPPTKTELAAMVGSTVVVIALSLAAGLTTVYDWVL